MLSMRLPIRPSRKALTIGIPPATAASKASGALFFSASAASLAPCMASIALLAVTTPLPAFSAASADQFDDDLDFRIGRQLLGLRVPAPAAFRHVAFLAFVARRDGNDFHRPADEGRQHAGKIGRGAGR